MSKHQWTFPTDHNELACDANPWEEEKGSGLIILFPGTAAGAEGAFQAERGYRLLLPAVTAVRYTPFHAPMQRQQFAFRLRLVDMPLPAFASFHRTFGIPRGPGGRARQAERRVGPQRGGFDEVCPEGIPLDIPQHGQQVLVLLDGERFESPLPDVAGGLVMLVVAADVRGEQPLHPAGQIAVLARPEDQVKVIRHQTISEQPHRHNFVGGREEADERLVIGRLMKDPLAGISAAEDVVTVSTGGVAVRSGHRRMLTRRGVQSQNEVRPCFSSLISSVTRAEASMVARDITKWEIGNLPADLRELC